MIRFNGKTLSMPADFNQQVGELRIPVSLVEQNSLVTEVRGTPDGFLTVAVQQQVPGSAAGVVSTDGGTIRVRDSMDPLDGLTLVIPPGALAQPTIIRVAGTTSAPLFGDGTPGLTSVQLEPSGLTFAVPATLEVPYHREALDNDWSLGEETLSLLTFDEAAGVWVNLASQHVDREAQLVVSTGVAHFSYYTIRDDRLKPPRKNLCTEGCAERPYLPVLLVHGYQPKFELNPLDPKFASLTCGYGSGDTFGDLPALLADALPDDVDVFALEYNSGKSIAASAESLKRAVGKIRALYKTEPPAVTVIAHSMGGLVARYAIQVSFPLDSLDPKQAPIAVLATLATPHLGTNLVPWWLPTGCVSGEQLKVGSDFLEEPDGLNILTRSHPVRLSGRGPSYRLYIGTEDRIVVPRASGVAEAWIGGPDSLFVVPPNFPLLATRYWMTKGCSSTGTGPCDHMGDLFTGAGGIANITSTDHVMFDELLGIIKEQLWPADGEDKATILNTIMPTAKIVERLKINDKVVVVDVDRLIGSGYQGARRDSGFVIYSRTAREVEWISYGRYDGYYTRGDRVPDGVTLTFAWKADGTAYVGVNGPDDAVLVGLVDGGARMPFIDKITGTFVERDAFIGELKNLIAQGVVTGVTSADLQADSGMYPFRGNLDAEIFHRFSQPVFRVASALYLQGIPNSLNSPVMPLWTPLNGFGTGSATRGFTLSLFGAQASYAVAVANNDNGNWSSISLNGQEVVSNTHCCENYWRRTGVDPGSVRLATVTSWSQGAPMFNFAVVADELTVSDVTQTPPGGLSNNKPPILSKLLPHVWNKQ